MTYAEFIQKNIFDPLGMTASGYDSTTAVIAHRATPFLNGYALGLMTGIRVGDAALWHGGAINGFDALVAYLPKDRITVIALANLNPNLTEEIAWKLAAVAHVEPVPHP